MESTRLIHRFSHSTSILSLAATATNIYAGTQAGEILVIKLATYEKVKLIRAHNGSVLGLCLSPDRRLLFSCASDRVANIWRTDTLSHVASIYSAQDIGDLFTISYSQKLRTVYIGAQNTSLQWCDLNDYESRPVPDPEQHPFRRQNRFFDSSGPGGIRTPRPLEADRKDVDASANRYFEITLDQMYESAHAGYLYCMMVAPGTAAGLDENHDILITGGGEGDLKLWSLHEGAADSHSSVKEIHCLNDGRSEGETIFSFRLDGTFLFAGRLGGEINVWDLESKTQVRVVKAHDHDIHTLAIISGNILSAAMNGWIKTYNQGYQLKESWKAHDGKIMASTTIQSPSHHVYVTGGNDNTVALWNVERPEHPAASASDINQDALLELLQQFLSFHTVSGNDYYKADCHKGASWLRSLLKGFGAVTELLPTESGYNPVVYGRFHANSAVGKTGKTILFYGHYDVVGQGKEDKWASKPFELSGRDGYVYGRGASDNKGPILAAITAAADAFESKTLISDIVFLIEGEEEKGSRGFQTCVKNNKHLFGNIDWILLANSYWLDDEIPCLTYGLRGVIHACIEIQSPYPDMHSGVDGNEDMDEAVKDMVSVVSKLTKPDGRVAIPGFYDPVISITPEERVLYDQIAAILLAQKPELGSTEKITKSLLARWRTPVLTIHGMKQSGDMSHSIIPCWSSTNVSVRLVPNQEAKLVASQLVDFIEEQFENLHSDNTITVKITHQADPWVGDFRSAIYKTLENAVLDVWGRNQPQSPSSRPTVLSPVSAGSSLPLLSSTLAGQSAGMQSGSLDSTPPLLKENIANVSSSARPRRQETPSQTSATTASPKPTLFPPADVLATTSSRSSKANSAPSVNTRAARASSSSDTPKLLYIREGGSIPAIRFLEVELGAQAAHLPCGLASDNAHLNNERMRVLNLWNSKAIFRKVFCTLGLTH